jgi:hypothetical protein
MNKTYLLLIYFFSLSSSVVKVPDLSDESVIFLRKHYKNNPTPFTAQIGPISPFIDSIVAWGNHFIENNQRKKSYFFTTLSRWVLGGTLTSYSAVFYLILRAYRLIKKIHTATDQEEIVLYGRRNKNNLKVIEIEHEINVYEQYLFLDKLLSTLCMRKVFPKKENLDKRIKKRICILKFYRSQLLFK